MVILLLVYVVQAQEDFNQYKDLDLVLYLGSNLTVDKLSTKAKVDYIVVDILLFPRDEARLKIKEMTTFSEPKANITLDKKATFRWEGTKEDYLKFGIKSKVNIKNDIARINKKIDFPIKDPVYSEYLKYTHFIDINQEIYDKANELVEGEDDLYFAVFKIADWVRNNIEYNLNTLTEQAVQKSTWVFQNREGVCDEITNLFISMLRSVGIPARFVSGTVYSNVISNWGSHGWTEVYFPGSGWVPFDVTFGQYGWVDASHLKLSDTADSGESSLEYSWRSYDIDLKIEEVTLNTSLDRAGEKFEKIIDLDINTLGTDNFGFGSFVPIEITATNLKDGYLSTNIVLTKAPDLIEKNSKTILLRPRETKTVYFIGKISNDLEDNFEYSAEIEAKDSFGGFMSHNLFLRKDYEKVNLQEVKFKIDSLIKRETKTISPSLGLDCKTERDKYYSDEEINIECTIKNKGNIMLKDVKVCLKNKCETNDIRIGEEKPVKFMSKNGREILITAETDQLISRSKLNIDIIEVPDIFISGISHEEAGYDEEIELEFTANTNFRAYNTTIIVNKNNFFDLKDFEGSKNVSLKIKGKKLVNGLNIMAVYYDEEGNKYSRDFSYGIKVNNLPWYRKLINIITFSK